VQLGRRSHRYSLVPERPARSLNTGAARRGRCLAHVSLSDNLTILATASFQGPGAGATEAGAELERRPGAYAHRHYRRYLASSSLTRLRCLRRQLWCAQQLVVVAAVCLAGTAASSRRLLRAVASAAAIRQCVELVVATGSVGLSRAVVPSNCPIDHVAHVHGSTTRSCPGQGELPYPVLKTAVGAGERGAGGIAPCVDRLSFGSAVLLQALL
jgi:hypothetical protein